MTMKRLPSTARAMLWFAMFIRLTAFRIMMVCPTRSLAFQSPSRSGENDLLPGMARLQRSDKDESPHTKHGRYDAGQETRRSMIGNVLSTCLFGISVGGPTLVPCTTLAEDETSVNASNKEGGTRSVKQPYAPMENLLPATRVRVFIDGAVDTAGTLVQLQKESSTDRSKKTTELIADLEQLLLQPRQFMTPEEEVASKRYLEQKTWADWTKARRKETENMFQIDVDPATRANEAFEQWGERRQFKRLRRQQLALERSNNMRAAFNAYTNNLVFGESYTLNANKDERKRLIRTYDQLPDVTSVIRSDLDLRDLYRNQVLTFTDDAKAELEYQLKKSGEPFDATELLSILKEAQSSCLEWFKFVPENDAKDALNIVRQEKV